MPSTSAGALVTAPTASRLKRASTPASSAAAMASGMRSITRSNARVRPAATISRAQTMNAPIASGSATPWLPASSAAPGVD